MKVYFDMNAPLFLVEEPGFDNYTVEVSKKTMEAVNALNETLFAVRGAIDAGGSPEDTAQYWADIVDQHLGSKK